MARERYEEERLSLVDRCIADNCPVLQADFTSYLAALLSTGPGVIYIGIEASGKVTGVSCEINAIRQKLEQCVHGLEPKGELVYDFCDTLMLEEQYRNDPAKRVISCSFINVSKTGAKAKFVIRVNVPRGLSPAYFADAAALCATERKGNSTPPLNYESFAKSLELYSEHVDASAPNFGLFFHRREDEETSERASIMPPVTIRDLLQSDDGKYVVDESSAWEFKVDGGLDELSEQRNPVRWIIRRVVLYTAAFANSRLEKDNVVSLVLGVHDSPPIQLGIYLTEADRARLTECIQLALTSGYSPSRERECMLLPYIDSDCYTIKFSPVRADLKSLLGSGAASAPECMLFIDLCPSSENPSCSEIIHENRAELQKRLHKQKDLIKHLIRKGTKSWVASLVPLRFACDMKAPFGVVCEFDAEVSTSAIGDIVRTFAKEKKLRTLDVKRDAASNGELARDLYVVRFELNMQLLRKRNRERLGPKAVYIHGVPKTYTFDGTNKLVLRTFPDLLNLFARRCSAHEYPRFLQLTDHLKGRESEFHRKLILLVSPMGDLDAAPDSNVPQLVLPSWDVIMDLDWMTDSPRHLYATCKEALEKSSKRFQIHEDNPKLSPPGSVCTVDPSMCHWYKVLHGADGIQSILDNFEVQRTQFVCSRIEAFASTGYLGSATIVVLWSKNGARAQDPILISVAILVLSKLRFVFPSNHVVVVTDCDVFRARLCASFLLAPPTIFLVDKIEHFFDWVRMRNEQTIKPSTTSDAFKQVKRSDPDAVERWRKEAGTSIDLIVPGMVDNDEATLDDQVINRKARLFYCGERVDWSLVARGRVVRRPSMEQTWKEAIYAATNVPLGHSENPLKAIEFPHDPGAGASTLLRQIVYDIGTDKDKFGVLQCAVINHDHLSLEDLLIKLYQMVQPRKRLLILLDCPNTFDRFRMEKILREFTKNFISGVLLLPQRQKQGRERTEATLLAHVPRSLLVRHTVARRLERWMRFDEFECGYAMLRGIVACQDRIEGALGEALKAARTDQNLCTVFHLALAAFHAELKPVEIEKYVQPRFEDQLDAQEMLQMLSFADHFGHVGLPIAVVKLMLPHIRDSSQDTFRQNLSGYTQELLKPLDPGSGLQEMRHYIYSEWILGRVSNYAQKPGPMTTSLTDVTGLADLAQKFAKVLLRALSQGKVTADQIRMITSKVFLSRGEWESTDDALSESAGAPRLPADKFSPFIRALLEHDDAFDVAKFFAALVQAYWDYQSAYTRKDGRRVWVALLAHLRAHLGRFYAYATKDFAAALAEIEKAVTLGAHENFVADNKEADASLHHIKGTILREYMRFLLQGMNAATDLTGHDVNAHLPRSRSLSSCSEDADPDSISHELKIAKDADADFSKVLEIAEIADLSKVLDIASSACESFERARKQDPFSEYSYVTEVQLRIELMENIVSRSAKACPITVAGTAAAGPDTAAAAAAAAGSAATPAAGSAATAAAGPDTAATAAAGPAATAAAAAAAGGTAPGNSLPLCIRPSLSPLACSIPPTSALPASAFRLNPFLPRLYQDWAHPFHIRTRTGLAVSFAGGVELNFILWLERFRSKHGNRLGAEKWSFLQSCISVIPQLINESPDGSAIEKLYPRFHKVVGDLEKALEEAQRIIDNSSADDYSKCNMRRFMVDVLGRQEAEHSQLPEKVVERALSLMEANLRRDQNKKLNSGNTNMDFDVLRWLAYVRHLPPESERIQNQYQKVVRVVSEWVTEATSQSSIAGATEWRARFYQYVVAFLVAWEQPTKGNWEQVSIFLNASVTAAKGCFIRSKSLEYLTNMEGLAQLLSNRDLMRGPKGRQVGMTKQLRDDRCMLRLRGKVLDCEKRIELLCSSGFLAADFTNNNVDTNPPGLKMGDTVSFVLGFHPAGLKAFGVSADWTETPIQRKYVENSIHRQKCKIWFWQPRTYTGTLTHVGLGRDGKPSFGYIEVDGECVEHFRELRGNQHRTSTCYVAGYSLLGLPGDRLARVGEDRQDLMRVSFYVNESHVAKDGSSGVRADNVELLEPADDGEGCDGRERGSIGNVGHEFDGRGGDSGGKRADESSQRCAQTPHRPVEPSYRVGSVHHGALRLVDLDTVLLQELGQGQQVRASTCVCCVFQTLASFYRSVTRICRLFFAATVRSAANTGPPGIAPPDRHRQKERQVLYGGDFASLQVTADVLPIECRSRCPAGASTFATERSSCGAVERCADSRSCAAILVAREACMHVRTSEHARLWCRRLLR